MVKNSKDTSSELFFVELKDPSNVRRQMLEALKEILEVLQKFDQYKKARQQRLDDLNQLRNLVKDANKLLGSLKNKLPQTNLRVKALREVPAAKIHKRKKAQAKEESRQAPKKETEFDRIQSELDVIESKLRDLG